MAEIILYQQKDAVATITLNRPDVYNAFNDELSYALQDALKSAARDQQVRVVVLTGAGKAFCSGQDLKASQAESGRSFSDSLHKRYNPIIRAITQMPKPVICRLNGVAAGAGCSLALACDLILAAEDALLIEVFINIGLVPDSGSSYFLSRSVPYQKAFEWSTQASRISMEEAQQYGLVNLAVPREQLDEKVREMAERYAAAPTQAIGQIKRMLRKGQNSSLEEVLAYEAWQQEIAGRSNDYQEGVNAFSEKRPPRFSGN